MSVSASLLRLRDDLATEVVDHLLPYWGERTVDDHHGGFVGQIHGDDEVVLNAPKGVVLTARILWTFAAAMRVLDDPSYASLTRRAYVSLMEDFWDEEHQGVFWMIDPTGTPVDDKKHVYAQAFALYALAEYYRATEKAQSLEEAIRLFRILETHSFDREHGGYYEAFSRDWRPLDSVRLSDGDLDEKKSMNTHLHVMEAYTNLYRVWPSERVATRLRALVEHVLTVIFDDRIGHLTLFFSEAWERRSTARSFGHDIEASWLLTEAAGMLGDSALQEDARDVALQLARATIHDGVDADFGIVFEADADGVTDSDRHWWPQAEAVVGFLNAYEVSGDTVFRDAAVRSWSFIQDHLVDREHGEWLLRVSSNGKPYSDDDKVGPWKGPYHSVRACFEGALRIDRLLNGKAVPSGSVGDDLSMEEDSS